MKVVFDTNVLVSATFWVGEAFEAIRLVEEKKAESFLSREILAEYYEVMRGEEITKKTSRKNLFANALLAKVIALSRKAEPKRKLNVIPEDPEDNKILECAVEARADCIVTYNKAHLLKLKEFEGIRIISPKEFLKIAGK